MQTDVELHCPYMTYRPNIYFSVVQLTTAGFSFDCEECRVIGPYDPHGFDLRGNFQISGAINASVLNFEVII